MTTITPEMCAELERKARNCRDNARAELVIAAEFKEEYRRGISGEPTACKETHDRSMELYDFAIRTEHNARNFLKDAALFEVFAALGRARLP